MLYGNLISQRRSTTTSFYLFDGLGSTTQLQNSSGSVTDSYVYDSFGYILLTSGSTVNPFRYVGRVGYYMDVDTAQYYLGARFYAPGIGRFLSRDPLGFAANDANLYRYVGNNSINAVDPSGTEEWEWVTGTKRLGVCVFLAACTAGGAVLVQAAVFPKAGSHWCRLCMSAVG